MQLYGPHSTSLKLPVLLAQRTIHIDCFMQGRHAKWPTRHSIYINKLVQTAVPTYNLISMPSNREGYAGKRLCTYRTESTKLFEEVETGLRGLNAGKPNLSVWAALLDNLIKGTTLKDVFMVLNCPAPSYSGLQCNANKVGPLIVDMVREDLKRERTLLIYVLESYGFPRQILIPMEGDGRYNNPLHWPRDRDPFQPATQST